jgi:hypothetical protein
MVLFLQANDRPMSVSEAVIVYDGRGITARISRLTSTSMSVYADVIAPARGDEITVFIDGVGILDSCVTSVERPRIDLCFLTDTQARWRRIKALSRKIL